MKKFMSFLIIGVIGMTLQTAYAAEVGIQNQTIVVPEGESEFTVSLTLTEDVPYAGAEFGLALSKGIQIKEIHYEIDQDYMNIGPVVNSQGNHYFGFFEGENKYSGAYPIVVTLEKVDEDIKETSIRLEALNITRVDEEENVQTDKKILNQAVEVQFEAAVAVPEPEPPKEEIPKAEKPQVVEKPQVTQKPQVIEKPAVGKTEEKVEEEPEKIEKQEPITQVELTPTEDKVTVVEEVEETVEEVEKSGIPKFIIPILTIVLIICAFFFGRWMPKNKKEREYDERS